MEFRCRLGTPGGEIIERIYAADTEARLRQEFEEKGLYVLGISRAGGATFGRLRLPTRAAFPREFLVFNQELATLLKAGMPLVQSLDILRRRVANPLFKSVLDDVYERVRGGSSLSSVRGARDAVSRYPRRCWRREERQSRAGHPAYVSYVKVVATVKRKTISALVYPVILLACRSVSSRSSCCGSCRNSARSINNSIGRCRSRRGSSCRSRISPDLLSPDHRRRGGGRADVLGLDQGAGAARAIRPLGAADAGLGQIARKFSTSQAARTLATLLGGGIPLVNAIDVAARSIKNRYIARELQTAGQQVREGARWPWR